MRSDVARASRALRVLLLLKHAGYVRNFESTIRGLAERGHAVQIGFQRDGRDKLGMSRHYALIGRLVGEFPHVSHGLAPERNDDGWGRLTAEARRLENYLLYFEDCYASAGKLRARAKAHAPKLALSLLRRRPVRSRAGLRFLRFASRSIVQAAPSSSRIDEYLTGSRPDVLVVSPLVELNPTQGEYVRSAGSLRIPSIFAIYSWDNLTNKGRISDRTDVVAVWNDEQCREIVELHGIRKEQVVVTGAPPYDVWFDAKPSSSSAQLRARVGLPDAGKLLMYACSSPFIAPEEVGFVRRWLAALRESGCPSVASSNVLIRPHPQNAQQWQDAELSDLGSVVVWPRVGDEPIDAQSRADYFDSLYHCDAVVGINTSALVESAILGKPAYTVLDPQFRATQSGTLHFRHLLEVNGGLLYVSGDLPAHAAMLESGLQDPSRASVRSRRFVEAYIRPGDVAASATNRLVDAIEATALRRSLTNGRTPMSWIVRALLDPMVKRAEAAS